MTDVSRGTVAGRWDAGGLGCGELLLGLRRRLAPLPAGSLFELVATDAGVPVDLPSWCRLTGHELVGADRPVYLIRKRQEE
ncbi:MAG: sulfurtransferase TusA family protein [Acidimicrobiales bacterium]